MSDTTNTQTDTTATNTATDTTTTDTSDTASVGKATPADPFGRKDSQPVNC